MIYHLRKNNVLGYSIVWSLLLLALGGPLTAAGPVLLQEPMRKEIPATKWPVVDSRADTRMEALLKDVGLFFAHFFAVVAYVAFHNYLLLKTKGVDQVKHMIDMTVKQFTFRSDSLQAVGQGSFGHLRLALLFGLLYGGLLGVVFGVVAWISVRAKAFYGHDKGGIRLMHVLNALALWFLFLAATVFSLHGLLLLLSGDALWVCNATQFLGYLFGFASTFFYFYFLLAFDPQGCRVVSR